MKKLFVDVESSGLSSKEHDIHQLAYIIEINDEIKEQGEFKIRPLRFDNISPIALELGNVTIEQLKSYPEQKEVYPKIIEMLDVYINKYDKNDKFMPAGQNVQFDIKFLNEFFIKNGNKYFFSYVDKDNAIDSLPMARKLTKEGYLDVPNHQLGTLCKHFGIFLEVHDALNDIKATKELIYKLDNLKFEKFKNVCYHKLEEILKESHNIALNEETIEKIIRIFYDKK